MFPCKESYVKVPTCRVRYATAKGTKKPPDDPIVFDILYIKDAYLKKKRKRNYTCEQ